MALWDELAAALPNGGGPLVPSANTGQLPGPVDLNSAYANLPPQQVSAEVVRPYTPPAPSTVAQLPRAGSTSGGTLADLMAKARASNAASQPASGTGAGSAAEPAATGSVPVAGSAEEVSPLTNIPAGYGAPLGGLGAGLLANYLAGHYLVPKAYSAGQSLGRSGIGKLLASLERHLGFKSAGKPQSMGSLLGFLGVGRPSSTASSTATSQQQAQMAQLYANIATQLQQSMDEYLSGLGPQAQQRIGPYLKNDELATLAILAGMQANPTAGLPTSLIPAPTTTPAPAPTG